MILNKLTELYNQWGDDNHLSPLGSADEEMLRKDINHIQLNWLENFCDVWEKAQEVDDFMNEQKEVHQSLTKLGILKDNINV
jgi:hypothetical protein